ncbi:LysR family transcriptional regulator [Thermochromatium tepidum]|uniref:LysR family transcriptional regulator n=1 Tax=Thermochromatium tepidum ATCC 43061 TaxID=316276 RepID=A0A6I6EA98_THETI|nr:LysR family transcriptional regulator [Thermochromatium tepidum]QGU33528.1 LysR family transcriptional regulator [Thermochromatium tepidum ATCC 43061]
MELSQLETFVKVVQTGSFTRAAEQLRSQKAHVSRVVSQLEAELGVRLLARTTRSLSLTEVGREFFERAVGILGAADEARRAVQQAHSEPRGTLRLTCGVEFGMIAVSTWITAYLERYPQVRVDADFTGRLVDIVHEGFDLAIRVGPLADSTLTARKLGEMEYGLFAAPAYLARRTTPALPGDLASHDILAFAGGSHQASWILSQEGRQERIVRQSRLKANNVFAVRNAAIAGLGIAKLPLIIAIPAVRDGHLQPVLSDWAVPTVPIHAVFASARYLTPKVRAFIDLAVDAMRAGVDRVHASGVILSEGGVGHRHQELR